MPIAAPPQWPSNVAYLQTPVPSRGLPLQHAVTFCASCPPLPTPPPRLSIRAITDPDHPASGQSGLFNTSRIIPRGAWIRDYVGEVHTESEAKLDSDYDLALLRTETEVIGIDATLRGNESRFINDYRGVPGIERPNALFELRRFPLADGKGEGVRMSVWAGPKGIGKHCEILVSYGRGFWETRRKKAESSVDSHPQY